MVLRALIVAQIACVGLLGAAFRGAQFGPTARGLGEAGSALASYPVLLGFPLAVAIATRRAALPRWQRGVLLGVETALGFATLVAIWPAVQ
jgi:hypothetical protein